MHKRNILLGTVCFGLVALLGLMGALAQPASRAPAEPGAIERVPHVGDPAGGRLLAAQQVILQPVPGYEDVLDDATILALEPDVRKGIDGALNVQSTASLERHALLKWYLDGHVPEGSTITSAQLQVFCYSRTRDWDLTIDAYRMLAPWDETTVTWNDASEGVPWSAAGCGAGSDRVAIPDASTFVQGSAAVPAWVAWDVTSVVQSWVDTPLENHGLILIGSGGSVRYDFQSAESSATDTRPKLVVEYETGPISPTPTVTPELTYTPSITPTPSNTPTPTDSPTTWLDVSSAIPAFCSGSFSGNTTGHISQASQYGSAPLPYFGPEDIYVIHKTVSSDLSVLLDWIAPGIDLDVLLLDSADPDSLMGGEDVGWGDRSFTYPGLGPGTYYVVVDGVREQDHGSYIVSFACSGEPTPTPTMTNTPARLFHPIILGDRAPTFTPTPTPEATPTIAAFSVAINCGGEEYTMSDGWLYSADWSYPPGWFGYVDPPGGASQTDSTSKDIAGTEDDPIYQTHRYAMEKYTFEVPAGRYEVQLHFSEVFRYTATGDRVFDVVIEGQTVLEDFDMIDRGLKYTAYTHIIEIETTDGNMDIEFVQKSGYAAAINGIRLNLIGPASSQ